MPLAQNFWKTVVMIKNFCQRGDIVVKHRNVTFDKRAASN